ncbi:MAG: peptide methionine sulfoxide reductase MsrA, partial [Bacteroidetes bacterium]|nr:peptide methionine sulfoxide reductase MsrA [Bacteroidota bacterium]
SVIGYRKILELFWEAHDPTTFNRQGADIGSQYRSIILFENESQRAAAEQSRAEAGKTFPDPIVTEIVPLKKFTPAEEYHQDYFQKNPNAPYCMLVIQPKLRKLDKGK